MPSDLAQKMLTHFEEERAAIRSASFGLLETLGHTKQHLFDQLDNASLSQSELRKIAACADRNLKLLDAALRGVAAATRRLAEQRALRNGFDTYGPDGSRDSHRCSPKGVERRA